MASQQFDTEDMYDRLRRAVLDDLRSKEQRSTNKREHHEFGNNMRQFGAIDSLLPANTMSYEEKSRADALVYQIYHELYLERIIFPGTADSSSTGKMSWPWYQVTDYGRRVLQTSEYCPYDPDGYLRRLKSEIPNLDETIVRYVEESLRCLRVNCLLAAAVTIGCASEQAMLLLVEAFGQAITDLQKKREYEKDTGSWIISRKYKAFRRRLDGLADSLPEPLRTPLEQTLHGIFDLIRQIRNDAGHPTGGSITPDLIRSSHIGFPGYCKYAYAMMDHFAQNGVNL
jgi:hypothetical protein